MRKIWENLAEMFTGYYSVNLNVILQVTTATALYQAGVSEDLIMKRTGHRSIDAVRVYKRPSDEQLRHVSDLLQPPSSKKVGVCNLYLQNAFSVSRISIVICNMCRNNLSD